MSKAGKEIENPRAGGRRYYHPTQKDYATFLETIEESGGERSLIEDMRLPGIYRVAEPLFRLLASRARRKGIYRELEARYSHPG